MAEKNIFQKGFDGLLTVLGLSTNAAASVVDVLHDGKLDRPFLENSFSAMYKDHKDDKGEEWTGWDTVGGIAMDIILDPTTYISGGASSIGKLDDALKIAKSLGKVSDVSALKNTDEALKILAESKKALQTAKETTKQTTKAIKKLDDAEKVLTSTGQHRNLKTVLGKQPSILESEYILGKVKQNNTPNLITVENANKGTLNQMFISDDVKLYANDKIKLQRKKARGVISGDYEHQLKELNKNLKKFEPVAKELDDTIAKGFEELSPRAIKIISEKTGLSLDKSKYAIKDYKKTLNQIETLTAKNGINNHSIRAIGTHFFADTVNESTKIGNAVDSLISRESQQLSKQAKGLANKLKVNIDDFYNQIINYTETGVKGFLDDDSIKFADEIQEQFKAIHNINEVTANKNLARVKDIGYIPRKLVNPTKESTEVFNKFAIVTKSKSATRESANKSFAELNQELAKHNITMNNNVVELLEQSKRTANRNAQLGVLSDGTKKYRMGKEIDGVIPTTHKELRGVEKIVNSGDEMLKGLKSSLTSEELKKLNKANRKSLIENLPKILGDDKAAALIKTHSMKFQNIDTYYPKQVLDKLDYFFYRNKNATTTQQKMVKGLKTYTQAWKKWTLALAPSFHVNNVIDTANSLFIAKPEAFAQMGKSLKLIRGKPINIKTPFGTKTISIEDLIEGGVTGGKYSKAELDLLDKVAKSSDTTLGKIKDFGIEKVLKGNNKIIEAGFNLGSVGEDVFRIAYTLDDLQKGISIKDSVNAAKNFFYDSSSSTEFVKHMSSTATPFLSWLTFNTKTIVPKLKQGGMRNFVPLKMVKASKVGEEEFSVKDNYTDTPFGFRFNKSETLNLTPKFSQLEPLDMVYKIVNSDNPGGEFLEYGGGYLSSLVGVVEAIGNWDFSPGREISTTRKPTERLMGLDVDKRIAHAVKSQVRLVSILDNVLRDSEDNYLWETFDRFGGEQTAQELADNMGYLFFGSSFNRDIEKSAEFAIRDLGKDASNYKRAMQDARIMYQKTGNEKYLDKAENYRQEMREAKQQQNQIKRELPKIQREQQKIQKDLEKKYDIDLSIPNPVELIQAITNKNDKALSEKTKVEVLEVLDGDTVKVRMPNSSTEYLRLAGLNTPEKTAKYHKDNVFAGLTNNTVHYNAAKNELEKLLKGKKITIQSVTKSERDNYNRHIVKLLADDLDVNKYLLENGFANPEFLDEITDKKYKNELIESSKDANKKQKGYWKGIENKKHYQNMFDFQIQEFKKAR